MELTDDTRRILQVLGVGRANVHHICQQGHLDEPSARRHLAALGDDGLVTEVDRNLFAVTPEGRAALDAPYPDEAGFLQEATVVHDTQTIKTLRFHGESGCVEVQVDTDSVTEVADSLGTVLSDTHGDHDAVDALADIADLDR